MSTRSPAELAKALRESLRFTSEDGMNPSGWISAALMLMEEVAESLEGSAAPTLRSATGGGERDCAHTVWAWNAEKARHVCAHCGADREGQFEPLSTPPSASPAGVVPHKTVVCSHVEGCQLAQVGGLAALQAEADDLRTQLATERAAVEHWKQARAAAIAGGDILKAELEAARAARAELEAALNRFAFHLDDHADRYEAECFTSSDMIEQCRRVARQMRAAIPKVVLAGQEEGK